MQLAPGDTFDRYLIEAELGDGGMGRVYRARDPKLDRAIALKVLRDANDSDASKGSGQRARLIREARAAAALDHPNVVAIFDVGEVDGTPFIAMELVRGRSLRAVMRDPDVAPARKLRWLADVARALAAAHERGSSIATSSRATCSSATTASSRWSTSASRAARPRSTSRRRARHPSATPR